MMMVMGTVQIGNPVGQPQIIPISGDLRQNEEVSCCYKKLSVQTYLQMLGAVSAVQQVWYGFKRDFKLPSFARGSHHDCEKVQTFQVFPEASKCNKH